MTAQHRDCIFQSLSWLDMAMSAEVVVNFASSRCSQKEKHALPLLLPPHCLNRKHGVSHPAMQAGQHPGTAEPQNREYLVERHCHSSSDGRMRDSVHLI